MSRIITFVVRRPRAIISMVVALSAFLAFGLWRGVQLDVSPLGFVEEEGQARADFETARKNFGPDDYLVVAVVCDDVFAPPNIARLRDLHDRISKTRGVAEVLSLVNAPYARSAGGVVSAESLIPDGATGRRGDVATERREMEGRRDGEREGDGETGVTVAPSPRPPVVLSPDPQSAIEEVRRLATGDKLYVGNLVSADSGAAALNILLKSDLSTATRHVIT